MKSTIQSSQQQSVNEEYVHSDVQSPFTQFGSNAERNGLLTSTSGNSIAEVFALIVQGSLRDAKDSAHHIAEMGRKIQDNRIIQQAGQVWTIANSLGQIQEIINKGKMDGVKQLASTAADLTRVLMGNGVISQGYGERILVSAGGYWNMAESAAKESSSVAGGAASNAQNSETVDQHRLSSSRGWAYCGIATSMMMLYANGKGDKNNVSRERDQLISEMYNYNAGTDVDQMAAALRKRGLTDSKSTRNGTFSQLISSLDAGQPVPFGITHMTGTITKLNSNGSKNYPYKKAGDRHNKQYGASGHWVLVVSYEGTKESPTHFIINDPDLGGQVRATKAEVERMGVGNGQFFQVYQQ